MFLHKNAQPQPSSPDQILTTDRMERSFPKGGVRREQGIKSPMASPDFFGKPPMKMLYFVNDVSNGQVLFCGSTREDAEEFIQDEVRASDYLYASSDFIIEECQEETFLKEQAVIVNLYLGLLWQAQRKLNWAQTIIDKRNAPPTVN